MPVKGKAFARPSIAVVPDHTYPEIMAIRAFADGTASPNQQQMAYSWLLKKACMVGGLSYNPALPNEIFINEGRRFVGVSLVQMTTETQESIDQRFPGPKSGRERREQEGSET